MASARYTRYIDSDNNKPELQAEMTKKEKWSNFWYYHKFHILAIAVAVLLVGMFVYEIVTQVKYDYSIAVISEQAMPQGTIDALKRELELICDDFNTNGKVDVEVLEYNFSLSGETIQDPNIHAANITRLMGDIQTGQCMLFITNDVKSVQERQTFFAYNDGSTPRAATSIDYTKMGVKWSSSKTLQSMNLGKAVTFEEGNEGADIQEVMSDFYLVKRAYYDTAIEKKEKLKPYYESSMAIFDKLTQ